MLRTMNAVSDRLLGLLVPRVTAKAEPCGPLDAHYCGCGGNWTYDKAKIWQTKDDPGFVDAAHGNFELRSDAEVFKRLPRFKPIPFKEIGPR